MRILPAVPAAFALIVLPAFVAAAEMEPLPPLAGQASQVAQDVEITLRADWQVGDSYRIESIKERHQLRNGTLGPAHSSRSILEAAVTEKGNPGYVIVLTVVETELSTSAGQKAANAAAALGKLVEGKAMEIATNEDGFPTGLRNTEEVIDLMHQAMDQVFEILGDQMEPEKLEQIRQITANSMTPEVIEAMALKDAMIFFGLMGGSYSGGPAQVYSGQMAFPFTQTPIESELYVLLRRIEEEKGLLHIATQSIPDPEQLKQATEAWMTRMMQSQGQTVPDNMAIPAIRMQDSLEYVYDRNLSLPREVTFRRYLGIDDANKRIELETFRLLQP